MIGLTVTMIGTMKPSMEMATMMDGMMIGMTPKKMNGGMAVKKKINSGKMEQIGNHRLMKRQVPMDLLLHHRMTSP